MGKKKITEIDETKHLFEEAEKAHGSDLEINEDKEEDNA